MDLIDAIMENNQDRVLDFLNSNININRCDDSDKITPLHHAVAYSGIEIVFLLLEFGANPFEKSSGAGETPIELACRLEKWDMIFLFSRYVRENA